MDESAFGVVHKKYWGASHANMTRPIKWLKAKRAERQEALYGPMSTSGFRAPGKKIDRNRPPYGVN